MYGLKMKYFVMKPKAKNKTDAYAAASQNGMIAYADNIREINPALADELALWAQSEAVKQARFNK